MPFLTEELWAAKGANSVLALASWPDPDDIRPAERADMDVVIQTIDELRSVRTDLNLPWKEKIEVALTGFSEQNTTVLSANAESIVRLSASNIVGSFTSASAAKVITVPVAEGVLKIALPETVDLEAEAARLHKEKVRLDGEIAKIDAKLANKDFLARAPEEVVEEQRERREAAEARLRKIEEALARLKAGVTEPA
jgi:valyl-tRNA synthetase